MFTFIYLKSRLKLVSIKVFFFVRRTAQFLQKSNSVIAQKPRWYLLLVRLMYLIHFNVFVASFGAREAHDVDFDREICCVRG